VQQAKQGERGENAARGNGSTKGDLLVGQSGDERLHDGYGLGIGAGSEVEENTIYPESLEVGRQLIAGGEPCGPCGPLSIMLVFGMREAANPGKMAGDSRWRGRWRGRWLEGQRRQGSRSTPGHRWHWHSVVPFLTSSNKNARSTRVSVWVGGSQATEADRGDEMSVGSLK